MKTTGFRLLTVLFLSTMFVLMSPAGSRVAGAEEGKISTSATTLETYSASGTVDGGRYQLSYVTTSELFHQDIADGTRRYAEQPEAMGVAVGGGELEHVPAMPGINLLSGIRRDLKTGKYLDCDDVPFLVYANALSDILIHPEYAKPGRTRMIVPPPRRWDRDAGFTGGMDIALERKSAVFSGIDCEVVFLESDEITQSIPGAGRLTGRMKGVHIYDAARSVEHARAYRFAGEILLEGGKREKIVIDSSGSSVKPGGNDLTDVLLDPAASELLAAISGEEIIPSSLPLMDGVSPWHSGVAPVVLIRQLPFFILAEQQINPSPLSILGESWKGARANRIDAPAAAMSTLFGEDKGAQISDALSSLSSNSGGNPMISASMAGDRDLLPDSAAESQREYQNVLAGAIGTQMESRIRTAMSSPASEMCIESQKMAIASRTETASSPDPISLSAAVSSTPSVIPEISQQNIVEETGKTMDESAELQSGNPQLADQKNHIDTVTLPPSLLGKREIFFNGEHIGTLETYLDGDRMKINIPWIADGYIPREFHSVTVDADGILHIATSIGEYNETKSYSFDNDSFTEKLVGKNQKGKYPSNFLPITNTTRKIDEGSINALEYLTRQFGSSEKAEIIIRSLDGAVKILRIAVDSLERGFKDLNHKKKLIERIIPYFNVSDEIYEKIYLQAQKILVNLMKKQTNAGFYFVNPLVFPSSIVLKEGYYSDDIAFVYSEEYRTSKLKKEMIFLRSLFFSSDIKILAIIHEEAHLSVSKVDVEGGMLFRKIRARTLPQDEAFEDADAFSWVIIEIADYAENGDINRAKMFWDFLIKEFKKGNFFN